MYILLNETDEQGASRYGAITYQTSNKTTHDSVYGRNMLVESDRKSDYTADRSHLQAGIDSDITYNIMVRHMAGSRTYVKSLVVADS